MPNEKTQRYLKLASELRRISMDVRGDDEQGLLKLAAKEFESIAREGKAQGARQTARPNSN